MMMSDTLASYGGLARFKDVQRQTKINETTLLGGSGEFSDYQFITNNLLKELVLTDFIEDDGYSRSSAEVHSYLARVLYNRRSRMNPLYNQLIVAGFEGDKSFLGAVDLYGSSYTDDLLATGYGTYLAIPILRKKHRVDMSEAEAKKLLEECMTVLFYRDCRTINRYHLGKVTAAGVEICDPYSLKTEWEYKRFINPQAVAL
jgi:20S proteasome subunit beta 7